MAWENRPEKRNFTPEEKEEAQELILELYSRRLSRKEMQQELAKQGHHLALPTIHMWLQEAIRKQEIPDPGYALRRDLLLVDKAIAALMPSVAKGTPSAHLALARWMDRRAKWLGLDAPDKLEAIISDTHTGSIDAEIRVLTERLGLQPPVIDAEIEGIEE